MKKLKLYSKASEFDTKDYLDREVRLSDYQDKKVLLSFFRSTYCPFCLARIKELVKRDEDLKKKGIQSIAVVSASKESIIETSKENSAPFPIIPDPEHQIFESYGLEETKFILLKTFTRPIKALKVMLSLGVSSKKMKAFLPANFIIDEEQQIEEAYYGKYLGDHISLNELINA